MGIGYQDIFFITFLTHPGVIIPSEGGSKFPIPKIPPFWAAMWQLLWYWILWLVADGPEGGRWAMFVLQIIFILLYAYFILRIRVTAGI
jgi:hypothetical protein